MYIDLNESQNKMFLYSSENSDNKFKTIFHSTILKKLLLT